MCVQGLRFRVWDLGLGAALVFLEVIVVVVWPSEW